MHKDLAATRELVGQLRAIAEETPRPTNLGELEISITPAADQDLSEGDVEAFAQLGVHRLILWPMQHIDNFEEQLRYIERSERLIRRFG